MFTSILYIELFKIFRRPRTYIAFGAIALIVLLVQFALRVNGTEFIRFFTDSQADTFEIPEQQILNGYFVCVAILHLILIHVPLLVALIAGDMIAGEAQSGTLRMLASQPTSRTTLILAKFSASTVYVVLLLLWMALFALFGSLLLFGQEGAGMSEEAIAACPVIYEINQYGSTRSMNASAAGAIAMYHWALQHLPR